MQPALRRAATASPLGRVPEVPVVVDDNDWAQAELSSYFKQHPEKLSAQLDRIMDKLREAKGDMQGFIVELDGMVSTVKASPCITNVHNSSNCEQRYATTRLRAHANVLGAIPPAHTSGRLHSPRSRWSDDELNPPNPAHVKQPNRTPCTPASSKSLTARRHLLRARGLVAQCPKPRHPPNETISAICPSRLC
jgi:hypothetical protein